MAWADSRFVKALEWFQRPHLLLLLSAFVDLGFLMVKSVQCCASSETNSEVHGWTR